MQAEKRYGERCGGTSGDLNNQADSSRGWLFPQFLPINSHFIFKDFTLVFVGGRGSDHNTADRLRVFTDARHEIGLECPPENILF